MTTRPTRSALPCVGAAGTAPCEGPSQCNQQREHKWQLRHLEPWELSLTVVGVPGQPPQSAP